MEQAFNDAAKDHDLQFLCTVQARVVVVLVAVRRVNEQQLMQAAHQTVDVPTSDSSVDLVDASRSCQIQHSAQLNQQIFF